MTTNLHKVAEFMTAFGQPILEPGDTPLPGRMDLRRKLILEEVKELTDEVRDGGAMRDIAKELADVEYVVLGMALEGGVGEFLLKDACPTIETTSAFQLLEWMKRNATNLNTFGALKFIYCANRLLVRMFGFEEMWDIIFDEVHRSNMSKLGVDGKPVYREDGKVLKGPNYFRADLSFLG